jgi:CHAD domain-containing protein
MTEIVDVGSTSVVPTPIHYALDSKAAGRMALQRVTERFPSRRGAPPARTETYFDTFDWRLYRDGSALSVTPLGPDRLLSHKSAAGAVLRQARHHAEPGLGRDLPAGPLRDALAPLVEARRLLPLVVVDFQGAALRVLGAENKTVASVVLLEGTAARAGGPASPASLAPRLSVVPVRGYDAAAAELVQFIESDLGLARDGTGELDFALAAVDVAPGSYSSKLQVRLEPETTAGVAVRRIQTALLGTIRANEDGVRHAVDPEFLHDFRVAVRRARSCLSQVEGVFPAATVERLSDELAWLGAITGPTRDLDVYLLNMDDYRSSLPPAVRDDLAPLGEFLGARQRTEQARLAAELDSERYRALVAGWRDVLESPEPGGDLPGAARPIQEVAVERIARGYGRVIEKGRAIEPASPARKLHRLRIECKKLRYLLEFFESLLAPADLEPIVAALKKLQDNLGEFNDLQVQQDTLRLFARQMIAEGVATVEALMAMGRLIERLELRQRRRRQRFAKRFARLDDPEIRDRMARLVGPIAGTAP